MVWKRNGKSERINTTTTWFSTHRRKKVKCPMIDHTDKQKNNPNHRWISKATCRKQTKIKDKKWSELLKISTKKNERTKTFWKKANNLFQLNKNVHFLKRPFSDTSSPIQLRSTSSTYIFQASKAKHNPCLKQEHLCSDLRPTEAKGPISAVEKSTRKRTVGEHLSTLWVSDSAQAVNYIWAQ